jgi:hypothetical protein
MNSLFGILDITRFTEKFSQEEQCLSFLAEMKWTGGYICRKCGHANFCRGKTPHSRRCTRCKHEESATAHTIFHRCHIPIAEAFRMVYMICSDPKVSSYEISRQTEIRQMTCWKLKSKLMECLEKTGKVDLMFSGYKVTR